LDIGSTVPKTSKNLCITATVSKKSTHLTFSSQACLGVLSFLRRVPTRKSGCRNPKYLVLSFEAVLLGQTRVVEINKNPGENPNQFSRKEQKKGLQVLFSQPFEFKD